MATKTKRYNEVAGLVKVIPDDWIFPLVGLIIWLLFGPKG